MAFVMFTDSVGQKFGWSMVELAFLCSMMSGVIAGRLERWRLELSAGSLTHMSSSGYWLLARGLSSSVCGLD